MKIFELLNPDEPAPSAPSDTSAMASPPIGDTSGANMTGASAPQQGTQTAGMMDTFKNFMTTPQPIGSASAAPPAPAAAAPKPAVPTPTPAAPPPEQSGGIMGSIKNFMTTPQPTGIENTAIGKAVGNAFTPTPPAPGQPPAQTSGIISRPFGNSVIGQNLDKLNTALAPKK